MRVGGTALLSAGFLTLFAAACTGDEAPSQEHERAGTIVLVDDLGDTLRLAEPATRVLSLVPSATEALLALGARDALVGRTDYDTDERLAELPSVGGGLGPSLEIVRTLEPDVVVTFGGESDTRTREALAAFDIATFEVRPERIDDAVRMIHHLGVITGRTEVADSMVAAVESGLARVSEAVKGREPKRTAYLLGGSPPWAAGPETFISDLITVAGGVNVLDDLRADYGPVSTEVLRDREIDVILSNEGSTIDARITRGRDVATVPAWVEIPGSNLHLSAMAVAEALWPDLRLGDRLEAAGTSGPGAAP